MSLRYDIGKRGDIAAVQLRGTIDRDAGDALASAYAAAESASPGVIELDFGHVDYINSTGIALIVSLLARARAQRITMRAVGLTPHYQHIFEITRLSDFIEIVQPIAG